jgi:dolichol-phosphate mannosyltransferase
MRVLVVTPTYLEAENIEEFLERLRAAAPDVDVLVVDDNSPDGTADLAEKTGARLGRIDVLRRPEKIGLGDAYRAGFALGMDRGYEMLVQIDADLSHDPRALPGLVAAVEDGADLAIGSRYVPGGAIPHWPWLRRALSKWGNRYTNFVLGMPINDATSGFRVYRADVLHKVDYASTRAKGYGFQIELAYRVWRYGGRIDQLPIIFTDRVRGVSKMTWQVAVEELTLVTGWGIRDRVFKRDGR